MPDPSIEDRILYFFLAMGAQRSHSAPPPASLSVTLGDQKVNIVVVKNDDLGKKGRIIDSLLGLTYLRSSSNQLYLAAPRLFGTSIDSLAFKSYGIGLLLYDERRIDETVEARSAGPEQASVPPAPDPAIIAELASLRSLCAEMERNIAKLREDVLTFRQTIKEPCTPVEGVRHGILRTQPPFAGGETALPSFFTNNPWLDVLSRRGRGDGEVVAG